MGPPPRQMSRAFLFGKSRRFGKGPMRMQKSYSSREVRVGLAGRRLWWGFACFWGSFSRCVLVCGSCASK